MLKGMGVFICVLFHAGGYALNELKTNKAFSLTAFPFSFSSLTAGDCCKKTTNVWVFFLNVSIFLCASFESCFTWINKFC